MKTADKLLNCDLKSMSIEELVTDIQYDSWNLAIEEVLKLLESLDVDSTILDEIIELKQ